MSYLKIGNVDVSHLVKSLKVGYETLVADGAGRNAAGIMDFDVIGEKVKLYVTFRPMDGNEMVNLLQLIKNYEVYVTYLDSRTNTLLNIRCYTGTPEPDYYWIKNNSVLYKEMSLNFIEF